MCIKDFRRLIKYTDYAANLENMLSVRLVSGIQHELLYQRLLSEGDSLTSKKAFYITLGIESPFEKKTVISSTKTEEFE